MIVTVTPNPSVDRTLVVPELVRGEVNRADAGQMDPGGKGVNVSRALAANDVATRAVLPLAGPDGTLLAALLTEAGITFVPVEVTGPTRSNISVVEPDGTLTKINAAGHPLSADEVETILDTATSDLASVTWVVGCGSLPPDTRPDFYAALVERARAKDVLVAIDTSGKPFDACLEARPDLVKPNLEELAELVGRPLDTIDQVVAAAGEVRVDGPHTIVVSLGKHGAVLVDGGEPVLAIPPPIVPQSNVGAGDSLLAGFLAGGGRGPDALRRGVAYGSAAASLPGTSMPRPHDLDLDGVQIQPAAGSWSLSQPSSA
jgi:1-phosphofructokinase